MPFRKPCKYCQEYFQPESRTRRICDDCWNKANSKRKKKGVGIPVQNNKV